MNYICWVWIRECHKLSKCSNMDNLFKQTYINKWRISFEAYKSFSNSQEVINDDLSLLSIFFQICKEFVAKCLITWHWDSVLLCYLERQYWVLSSLIGASKEEWLCWALGNSQKSLIKLIVLVKDPFILKPFPSYFQRWCWVWKSMNRTLFGRLTELDTNVIKLDNNKNHLSLFFYTQTYPATVKKFLFYTTRVGNTGLRKSLIGAFKEEWWGWVSKDFKYHSSFKTPKHPVIMWNSRFTMLLRDVM